MWWLQHLSTCQASGLHFTMPREGLYSSMYPSDTNIYPAGLRTMAMTPTSLWCLSKLSPCCFAAEAQPAAKLDHKMSCACFNKMCAAGLGVGEHSSSHPRRLLLPMHGALGLASILRKRRATQYPTLRAGHLLLHLPLLGVRRGKQHPVRFVCTLYMQHLVAAATQASDAQLAP